ncbi:MAG: hypothetical protein ACREFG_00540 [Chthoniobacterales bacterium]
MRQALPFLTAILTAALMSKLYNGETPLTKIALIGDFPICIAKDGTVIVVLQWDYAAWTPTAERFVESVQAAQNNPNASYLVALSGVVSPRLAAGTGVESLPRRGSRRARSVEMTFAREIAR